MAWETLKEECKNGFAEANATAIDLGISTTDLGVLSVSEDQNHFEPVCSEEVSNSDKAATHEMNVSFLNSSYPGDPDSDILSYPAPVIKKKKTSQKQKFFLLTSDEAREAKLKEIQEKAVQEEKKQTKKLD